MFLAQEFDAVNDGVPYISADRPRACQPEVLSRLIGYLDHAPEAAPGLRTDGVWVWPAALAGHARRTGAGPQRQLFEHIRAAHYLLPETVPDDRLGEAARVAAGPPTPDPTGPPYRYWLAEPTGSDPVRRLLRTGPGADGVEHESAFFRDGWDRSWLLREPADGRSRFGDPPTELSGLAAAEISNAEWARHHAANVAEERETLPGDDGLRVARVFDADSPQGLPWFTPRRLRLAEGERRRRLARYLSEAPVVVRTSARLVDPLGPGGDPVVPLNFRTDGVWVWQEALAYYVDHRGLAPELDLLRHIEERGFALPASVPGEVLARAAAAAMAGPRVAPVREPLTYLYAEEFDLLLRCPDRDLDRRGGGIDLLDGELLWSRTDDHARIWASGRLRTVPEAEAIRVIDDLLTEPGWATPGSRALN